MLYEVITRTVGPSLGKENIDKGFNSVTYGFIVLVIFSPTVRVITSYSIHYTKLYENASPIISC